MSSPIKIFDIFAQFKDKAPKNLKELDALIEASKKEDFIPLYNYLLEWKSALLFQIEREFDAHGAWGTDGYCVCGVLACSQMVKDA